MVLVTGFGLKVTLRGPLGRAVSGLAVSCLRRGTRSGIELLGPVWPRGSEAIAKSDEREGLESNNTGAVNEGSWSQALQVIVDVNMVLTSACLRLQSFRYRSRPRMISITLIENPRVTVDLCKT